MERLQEILMSTPGVVSCDRSRRTGVDREDTPAIVIRPDIEQDERFSQFADKRMFTAIVVVMTRGDPWDVVADPIVEAVHSAVMTDVWLKGTALDMRRMAREPEDTEADATAGQYSLHYRFTYLSRADSLSAQP